MASVCTEPGSDKEPVFADYETDGFYDEMFAEGGCPRPRTEQLAWRLKSLADGELVRCQKAADATLLNMGITFNVYGHEAGTEKVWPFDIIPRVMELAEWKAIEAGLKQRITALNLFINDLYHDQKIVRDGVFPDYMVQSSKCFLRPCAGMNPPRGIWCHITGTDLVRDADGTVYVLEDKLRCPSGVSYVLENREVMKRTMPQVFDGLSILPVEDYPEQLLKMLQYIAPPVGPRAQRRGADAGDLQLGLFRALLLGPADGRRIGPRLGPGGPQRLRSHADDPRPEASRRDLSADRRRFSRSADVPPRLEPGRPRPDGRVPRGPRRAGQAPGTGVADDKAVYAYVPQIIKYYLGEEIRLPNVPTYICADEKQRQHVLANLDKLVIKPTNESGGYGIMLGPRATPQQREQKRELIEKNPRNFVAQPMLSLSRIPTVVGGKLEGRHVDLRPYILYGEDIYILPGGLTRVALVKGSLVVNSSQGGGSKDTWVLKDVGLAAGNRPRACG